MCPGAGIDNNCSCAICASSVDPIKHDPFVIRLQVVKTDLQRGALLFCARHDGREGFGTVSFFVHLRTRMDVLGDEVGAQMATHLSGSRRPSMLRFGPLSSRIDGREEEGEPLVVVDAAGGAGAAHFDAGVEVDMAVCTRDLRVAGRYWSSPQRRVLKDVRSGAAKMSDFVEVLSNVKRSSTSATAAPGSQLCRREQ